MQINIEVFCKVILSLSVTRHSQSTQNKFTYLCNIFSIKAWGMKLSFYLQINTRVFYKLIVSPWVHLARQAQSLKRVRDEVDFLDADKHQSFLEIDFNTL